MQSKHKLGLGTATALVVGSVIGSGVFVKPGRVLALAGGSNEALLAWFLGGLMTLAGGLTVAEIAFRIPKTGGLYSFVEEIYGEKMGFIAGWVQALVYGPGLLATLSLYFASLLCEAVGITHEYKHEIALATLLSLCFVMVLSTRIGAFIQNCTTIIKLIPIFAIGICGLFMGHEPIFNFVAPSAEHASIGAAVLATLWAYDGWLTVANVAGEVENPSKNLPKAIIFGISLAMFSYLLVNFSLFSVLDKNVILSLNENAAPEAAVRLFGPLAGHILGFGILISIFGTLNGNLLMVTRVPYAMALNGMFPFSKVIGKIDPRFQTPLNSILLTTFIAAMMLLFFNPDRIGEFAIFSMYIFFALVFFGIFKIRAKYGRPEKGSYRIPGYPVVPLLAIAGCAFICFGLLQDRPMDVVLSLGVALLGMPFYFLLKRKA